jgi:hypothetical protein
MKFDLSLAVRATQVIFGIVRIPPHDNIDVVLGVSAGGTTHISENSLNFLVFVV